MTDTNLEPTATGASIGRRRYLQAAAAAGLLGLAGCAGDDEGTAGATGVLSTQVTDQPGDIADFESCVVTIEGIWTKSAETDDEDDNDTETDTGTDDETQDEDPEVDQSDERAYHPFEEPQTADLVELQGENTQLVDDRALAVGSYRFLQLDVSAVDGVLEGGESVEVDTPGNAPLQFKQSFEVRADERTVFTADFTPVRRGQTGGYLLQPVADGTTVRYEPIEDDESGDDGDGENGNETAEPEA